MAKVTRADSPIADWRTVTSRDLETIPSAEERIERVLEHALAIRLVAEFETAIVCSLRARFTRSEDCDSAGQIYLTVGNSPLTSQVPTVCTS
jgi:hypothetical protein